MRMRARLECADVDIWEMCGGGHVPLPLDHFFFCFLPPVAEGAILSDM